MVPLWFSLHCTSNHILVTTCDQLICPDYYSCFCHQPCCLTGFVLAQSGNSWAALPYCKAQNAMGACIAAWGNALGDTLAHRELGGRTPGLPVRERWLGVTSVQRNEGWSQTPGRPSCGSLGHSQLLVRISPGGKPSMARATHVSHGITDLVKSWSGGKKRKSKLGVRLIWGHSPHQLSSRHLSGLHRD